MHYLQTIVWLLFMSMKYGFIVDSFLTFNRKFSLPYIIGTSSITYFPFRSLSTWVFILKYKKIKIIYFWFGFIFVFMQYKSWLGTSKFSLRSSNNELLFCFKEQGYYFSVIYFLFSLRRKQNYIFHYLYRVVVLRYELLNIFSSINLLIYRSGSTK